MSRPTRTSKNKIIQKTFTISGPITPEIRAKVLSSIKDDGMAIAEAAKTYALSEDTVKKLVRGTLDNAQSSSAEYVRLRRENTLLKEIIGNLFLERAARKNLMRP